MTVTIGALSILLLLILLDANLDANNQITFWVIVTFFITVIAALVGACTFLADKRGQSYRFFAEHAVSPRLVWLSRQCVGLATVMALGAVVFAAALSIQTLGFASVFEPKGEWREFQSLGYWIGIVVLSYSAGQLCSMLLRSGLLAGVCSLALAGLLVVWAVGMAFIGASWLWSVAPIAVALLLATWLRTPHWLLERQGWRPWLPVTLALGLPTIAILVAVPFYRVYQIPLQDPGFSVSEFSQPITADQQATADMYRRACQLLEPIDWVAEGDEPNPKVWQPPRLSAEELRRLDRNQESLDLALEASARDECVFEDPSRSNFNYPSYLVSSRSLSRLLVTSARKLQSQGDLDEAFERYRATLRFADHMRNHGLWRNYAYADLVEREAYEHLPSWAAATGQTPERVRKAIAELEDLASNGPPMTDAVRADYLLMQRVFTADTDSLSNFGLSEQDVNAVVLIKHWAPWELVRARRLLNIAMAETFDIVNEAEWMQRQGNSILNTPSPSFGHHKRLMRSTWLLGSYHYNVYYIGPDLLIRHISGNTVRRRGTLILMALSSWRQEHNTLPQTLGQLVGPYFERLPQDPYTGIDFHYRREGFPTPIRFAQPLIVDIPADWPLIWSVGQCQSQVVLTGTNQEGLEVYRTQWTSVIQPTAYVIDPSQPGPPGGRAFPLPEFKEP